jgi:hypothetical protein
MATHNGFIIPAIKSTAINIARQLYNYILTRLVKIILVRQRTFKGTNADGIAILFYTW